MRIKLEKDLDKKLIMLLAKHGNAYKVDVQWSFGFPDVYFVGRQFSCWIENKVETKIGDKVGFRNSQPKWLKENHKVAKTFVLIYYKKNNVCCLYEGDKAYQLYNGEMVQPLKEYTQQTINQIHEDLHEYCTRVA